MQKTAYEMRISDWSSDVCSSDLNISTRFHTFDHSGWWSVFSASIATRVMNPKAALKSAKRKVRVIASRPASWFHSGSVGKSSSRSASVSFGILASLLQHREWVVRRSEEHTSELQSLMRISYAVFCLKK